MPAERRLAATMFTHIVGYTSVMAESEEKGLRARGQESPSTSPSALDAVNCALAIDERCANRGDQSGGFQPT